MEPPKSAITDIHVSSVTSLIPQSANKPLCTWVKSNLRARDIAQGLSALQTAVPGSIPDTAYGPPLPRVIYENRARS